LTDINKKTKMCYVVLCAAGESRRFLQHWQTHHPELPCPSNKLLAPLLGKALVRYAFSQIASLQQYMTATDSGYALGGVCIVTHTAISSALENFARLELTQVPLVFAEGGSSRQASVWAGLQALKQSFATDIATTQTSYVVVHDAARPLMDTETLMACITYLHTHPDYHGCCVGNPAVDTLKHVTLSSSQGATIQHTPARETLWQVQTPQVFQASSLWQAHESAHTHQDFNSTDDMQLLENYLPHGKQHILHSPKPNPKVTYPYDLAFCETLLKSQPPLENSSG
jgi:2-C-methyl-D-erythritol 4-phosphate cytidylyltransferase